MTKIDVKTWLDRFGDTPDELRQECKHGHKECSINRGGDCLDEVIKAAIPPEAGPVALEYIAPELRVVIHG